MKRNDREFRRAVVSSDRHHEVRDPMYEDPSIGELLNRLAADSSLLMRQEIDLAKAEVRESGERLKAMTRRMAIAATLALPGLMALTAFLVIAIGNAINSYLVSSLIVGVVLVLAALFVARLGMARVSGGKVGLSRTATSLAEGARWGKEEMRAFKREITA